MIAAKNCNCKPLKVARLLSIWCIVATAGVCSAFEVQGVITYESYLRGTTNLSTRKNFKVEVDECNWLIKTFVADGCITSEKAHVDGNLLSLTTHCAQSSGRGSNVFVGLIESEEMPDDDGSQINYIWLAYASACFFRNALAGELRPICCLDDQALRSEKFRMKSFYTLASEEPKLPNWLAYLNDGNFRTRNQEGRVVFPARPPYDQGYTNAVYAVRSYTNCGALLLPLRFEFTRFAVPYDPGVKGLVVRTRIIGQANAVAELHSSPELLPHYDGEFIVHDSRFKDTNVPIGQVRYKISNGEWLSSTKSLAARTVEIRHQRLRKRVLSKAAASNARNPTRTIVWCWLVISFVVVVLIWTKNKTMKGN